MNTLQFIEDNENLEGYMEHNGRKGVTIFINVEKLWKGTKKYKYFNKKVENFIKEFTGTYIHEMIHFTLRKYYKVHPKWYLGEEYVVWSLMGERMKPFIKKFYEEGLKYTRKNA